MFSRITERTASRCACLSGLIGASFLFVLTDRTRLIIIFSTININTIIYYVPDFLYIDFLDLNFLFLENR